MKGKKIDAIIIIGITSMFVTSVFLFVNWVDSEAVPVAYRNKGMFSQSDFQAGEERTPLSSISQETMEDNLSPFEIDTTKAEAGLIKIIIRNPSQSKMKLLVQKGTEKYSYTIGKKNEEYFPLQMGSGQYTIKILENIEDTQYRQIEYADISCDIADPNAVFLHSTQIVNWNFDMAAVKKAHTLTASLDTQKEKVEVIARYIAENYSYDWDKVKKVDSTYLPNLEEVFKQKKGICYDYACLLGAMTRSVGIPSRLCMGYSELIEGYHAWNEVYVNGEWHVVDTTVDAQYFQKKQSYSLFKDMSQYETVRIY